MSSSPRYLDEYTPESGIVEDYYDYLDPEEEATRPTDEEYREAVKETLDTIDAMLQDNQEAKERGHSIIENIRIMEEHKDVDYDDELWGIWVEEIEAWNTNHTGKTIEIGDGSGLLPLRELNYCNHQGREYQPYNRT